MRLSLMRLGRMPRAGQGGVVEVDHVRVSVRGGTGGAGLPQCGGIGGRGGDVVFLAHKKVTMAQFARNHPDRRIVAAPGADSRKLVIYGAKGKDLHVRVPKGVVLSEGGRALGELNKEGEEVVVAAGGEGGSPANNFKPHRPQTRSIHMDIKLLADIGLVGYPNAGKSTLLKSLSRTQPAISSFPFTTIKPQIGTLVFPDFRRISVADLPGLIEGAYRNVGMGHRFLKHVERTRLLLLVVDVFGFQLNQESPFRTPFQTLQLLNRELELYQEALLDKPAALVLNKLDLPQGPERAQELLAQLADPSRVPELDQLPPDLRPHRPFRFRHSFTTSALTHAGLQPLKDGLRALLDTVHMERQSRDTPDLSLPPPLTSLV